MIGEFYANALEAKGDIVQVQGKQVPFDPSSINTYFCLRGLKREENSKYRNGGHQWHKALKCLCRPRAVWETHFSEKLHISSNERSRYGLAWFYLLPYTRVTEVNRDKASLLYAIVKGKKINVRLIIYNLICQALKGDFMGGNATPVIDSRPLYGSRRSGRI